MHMLGAQRRHIGVGAKRGDVVDDRRAGVQRRGSDRRLRRVRRDRSTGPGGARKRRDHRAYAFVLNLGGDGLGTRPCRLASDVQYVGARRGKLAAVFDGSGGVQIQTAIGEGVRGDVEDAHHQGTSRKIEGRAKSPPLVRCVSQALAGPVSVQRRADVP